MPGVSIASPIWASSSRWCFFFFFPRLAMAHETRRRHELLRFRRWVPQSLIIHFRVFVTGSINRNKPNFRFFGYRCPRTPTPPLRFARVVTKCHHNVIILRRMSAWFSVVIVRSVCMCPYAHILDPSFLISSALETLARQPSPVVIVIVHPPLTLPSLVARLGRVYALTVIPSNQKPRQHG